jgi:uncharacterized membrane protein (Fun14 family)
LCEPLSQFEFALPRDRAYRLREHEHECAGFVSNGSGRARRLGRVSQPRDMPAYKVRLSAVNPHLPRILGLVLGAAAASGDGPWRARTVHLALFIVLVGLAFWVHEVSKGAPPPAPAGIATPAQPAAGGGGWDFTRPIPRYVKVCASYIGGFFIGWAFRRFLRLALAVGALVLLLVGVGKYAGWNTSRTEAEVKERAAWVRQEATAASDYLKGLLPSTLAGAVGAFLGFRRKAKPFASEVDQETP